MVSNVSDINALMAGNSSDALVGVTRNDRFSTNRGYAVSAFQGQLEKTMQQNPGMESTSDVSCVAEHTGANFSKMNSVKAEAAGQNINLSTGKQNSEISTLEASRFVVRTTIQKVSDIKNALENGRSTEFVTELKNLLLALSNGDLDNLSLDENGLEALGDLLVQAGFDPASVEELMSNLTLTFEAGDSLISVSDFMDDLLELPLAEDEDITQTEVLMPTSDLPYIQSLLSMMGVEGQTITSIMDAASEGPRGFDFDTFIEQLEQLLDTADESGLTYQTDSGDDAYTTLLKQLDLDAFIEKADAPLTLPSLIEALNQKLDLIKENLPHQTEQSVPNMFTTDSFDALATQSGRHGLLNQLFSGLNIQEDSKKTVDSAIPLSANSQRLGKEIEDRFQVRFTDQMSRGDAGTKRTADAAALEKMRSTISSQSGETTSKMSETQPFVFGVEKSTTATSVGASGTQRTPQAFSSLPDFVTRQVGKSIVRSINTGDDTIRMQLKPAELGRVYMSIEHNGSAMKVSVITEHQSAKDILAANVNEIKTVLSASGISLERFEVDMSSDFQQSMADARTQDQSGQSSQKRQTGRGADNDSQEDAEDNLSIQPAVINDSGSLHFVA
ncbi:MAG: flagellar hook-length control protein FliK [Desulfobacter postgatei]|uniref:Flagellar hook-length control protein FliK n=1 Tax=Desulfobacter postgatei TaxID=2293 RepID=A0A2G6MPR4_9BACT|nr:MAG: flagellar hook-length control protein FliK [Desulfobacter postgatei]